MGHGQRLAVTTLQPRGERQQRTDLEVTVPLSTARTRGLGGSPLIERRRVEFSAQSLSQEMALRVFL